MDISRSEKKRWAAHVENVAGELSKLSGTEINSLPTDDLLKREILSAAKVSGGAKKRQIKFIAKELREREEEYLKLLEFLDRRKGSRLRENQEFHQLEILRQGVISDAINAMEEARVQDLPLEENWTSPAMEEIDKLFPELDIKTIRTLANRYARTRKIAHSREIFRQLKGASELQARREAMAKE